MNAFTSPSKMYSQQKIKGQIKTPIEVPNLQTQVLICFKN